MHAVFRSFTAIVFVMIAGGASSNSYPERPVRLIVTGTPGSTPDVFARIIAQKFSEGLGKQGYVENILGAGGNIGMAAAAKAKPDGYTVLIAVSTFMVNPTLNANVRFDPIKDFAPITLLGVSHFVLVVNPSVPARDAQELITLIKGTPGKYNFASSGLGTTMHLLGELLKFSFDLDLVHVPFNGAGPAISATLAGSTPICFCTPTSVLPYVREGKLRALAVTSKVRLPVLPEVPTVGEAGLPGEGADTMIGALAPAGTPREIIDVLHREMTKIIAMPDVKEHFSALGLEPVGDTPEEFSTYISAEIVRWAKVIHDAKIRGE
jgi:tripartite-type tricarboxylate transporter receptor subunit TctC